MKKEKVWGLIVVFFIFASAFLLNCSSLEEPEPPQEQPIANPSFAQDIQAAIFNGSCSLSGGHNATASAGLNLTQGNAYNNLVNVNSTQDPTKTRVLPSDANNGYLVIKIEGGKPSGVGCPSTVTPLAVPKSKTSKTGSITVPTTTDYSKTIFGNKNWRNQ